MALKVEINQNESYDLSWAHQHIRKSTRSDKFCHDYSLFEPQEGKSFVRSIESIINYEKNEN